MKALEIVSLIQQVSSYDDRVIETESSTSHVTSTARPCSARTSTRSGAGASWTKDSETLI